MSNMFQMHILQVHQINKRWIYLEVKYRTLFHDLEVSVSSIAVT